MFSLWNCQSFLIFWLSAEEENTPSQTLIQRLAEFSMTQSGEDMTDIDPLTGAQTPRDTDADVIETDNRSKSPLFTRRKPPPEEQKGWFLQLEYKNMLICKAKIFL